MKFRGGRSRKWLTSIAIAVGDKSDTSLRPNFAAIFVKEHNTTINGCYLECR